MNISVAFPFQSSKDGNVAETFFASKVNVSPKNFCAYDLLNFTVGVRRIFFDAGIGMTTKLGGVSSDFSGGLRANFGAGVNFPLVVHGAHQRYGDQPFFYLKPSLNIQYNGFNVDLGTIDNSGTQISSLGVVSAPTFTYMTGGKYNRHRVSTNTRDLKISLSENYWMFVPKLSLATNPNRFILHLSLDAAYMMPFSVKERLVFTQSDAHSILNEAGRVKLNTSGLTLSDNNKPVTSLPYNLKCFYIGFTVGANVSDLK
jgi:hypothetical protein